MSATPSPLSPLVNRWEWLETNPGATNFPATSRVSSAVTDGVPLPIAAMRPSSTSIHPSSMYPASVEPVGIVMRRA
ncbi:hypothetical protein ACFPRL_19300 [Pseudoclavibacter helvolus]